ncbi:DUF4892 domain-containing protein [Cellvibrio japonicus]|uniref:DUF4892 domain-containing protein n=1 Tax=Cellvibrio japonicus (strain Ueda107) TaxID=498211 RepID=B3PHF8_CELJU|nr:DUF4892 domain-containing protein [Cellvibrio japonicus]ACE85635.1 conserved hypothetical protein [Cellvibrio japonicus Ueda107]
MIRIISMVLLLLCSASLLAQGLNIEQYPGARVIYQTVGDSDDYVLALGSYKKVAGSSWQPERSERLKGKLTRYTLELPVGHTPQNGFDFYLDQLQTHSIRELFYCAGRDCGTSNSWANNHFNVLQLYGLDQHQQYAAYEVIVADAKPYYASLYVVQRGNRRVYLQLDILHADQALALGVASSPVSIVKALNQDGYYVFPDLIADAGKGQASIQFKPAHVQVLVDVLNQQTAWSLALVGHDYAPQSLAQQQANSSSFADQLKAALVEKGIDAKRIQTFGLGSLAPAGRGDRSARVEVVKLP